MFLEFFFAILVLSSTVRKKKKRPAKIYSMAKLYIQTAHVESCWQNTVLEMNMGRGGSVAE